MKFVEIIRKKRIFRGGYAKRFYFDRITWGNNFNKFAYDISVSKYN